MHHKPPVAVAWDISAVDVDTSAAVCAGRTNPKREGVRRFGMGRIWPLRKNLEPGEGDLIAGRKDMSENLAVLTWIHNRRAGSRGGEYELVGIEPEAECVDMESAVVGYEDADADRVGAAFRHKHGTFDVNGVVGLKSTAEHRQHYCCRTKN